MIGRFHYYYQKFITKLRKHGSKRALLLLAEFLIRRKFFLQFALESLDYGWISRFRNEKKTLLDRWQSGSTAKPSGKFRALVYVSYDSESRIQDHVIEQLRFFHQQGYRIVFVSTSPELKLEARGDLFSWAETVLHRKNLGYDFVSYKLGFAEFAPDLSSLSSVVLMNDSCVGPLFDFVPALRRMESDSGAVYGITKSVEIAEYIQSYFLHFGEGVIISGLLAEYLARIRILKSKWAIVRFLEIGGSRWLRKRGVVLRALVDPTEPKIRKILDDATVTEPTKTPAAEIFIALGLLPFKKRKHGMKSP